MQIFLYYNSRPKFLTIFHKTKNIQFQYSAQTGLSLLKPALSNILYYSTLSVLMYTTDTCGNAVVLQNNVLITLNLLYPGRVPKENVS